MTSLEGRSALGAAEDAVEEFERAEKGRIQQWRETRDLAIAIRQAADRATGINREPGFHTQVRLEPPFMAELDIDVDWHRTGAVVRYADDPLKVYVHVTDIDAPTVNAYVVRPCVRCGRDTPHGPPAEGVDELGAAIHAGTPVDGHACTRRP